MITCLVVDSERENPRSGSISIEEEEEEEALEDPYEDIEVFIALVT
jgi:hypothetical protein